MEDAGIGSMPKVQGTRRQPTCMDMPCTRCSLDMNGALSKVGDVAGGARDASRIEERTQ